MTLWKDIPVSIQISDIAHFKIGGFMWYSLELWGREECQYNETQSCTHLAKGKHVLDILV